FGDWMVFKSFSKRSADRRDEQLLAENAARDKRVGLPTHATLNDRALDAALQGCWNAALAEVRKGADPNAARAARDVPGIFCHSTDDKIFPLAGLAIEQGRPDALLALLWLGADRFARVSERRILLEARTLSLVEYATLRGDAASLDILLKAGT